MATGFLGGFSQGYQGEKDRQQRNRLAEAMTRASTRDMENWYREPGQGGAPAGPEPRYTYDGKIGDRVTHAFNRFRDAGLPDHVAAGLVGNLMQESGPGIDPAAVGDSGAAFGAAQWNGPRKAAYMKYATSRGADPTDFDTQIDYLLAEGKGSERGAWDAIMQAGTPEDAARIASDRFWRPGTPHNERRMGFARAVYDNRQASPTVAPARTIAAQEPTDWPWFRNYGRGA